MSKEPNLSEYGNAYLRDVDKEKKTDCFFYTPEGIIACSLSGLAGYAGYAGRDISFPEKKIQKYKAAYTACTAEAINLKEVPLCYREVVGIYSEEGAEQLMDELGSKKAGLIVEELPGHVWVHEMKTNGEMYRNSLNRAMQSASNDAEKSVLREALETLDKNLAEISKSDFKPKEKIITIFDPYKTAVWQQSEVISLQDEIDKATESKTKYEKEKKSLEDKKRKSKADKARIEELEDSIKELDDSIEVNKKSLNSKESLIAKLKGAYDSRYAILSCPEEGFRSPFVSEMRRRFRLSKEVSSALTEAHRTPLRMVARGVNRTPGGIFWGIKKGGSFVVGTGGAVVKSAKAVNRGLDYIPGVPLVKKLTSRLVKAGFWSAVILGVPYFLLDSKTEIKDFRSSSNSASASLSSDDSELVKNFMKRQAEAGVGTHYGMTSERWKKIYASYEEGVATDKESCFNLVREISSQTGKENCSNIEQEKRSQSDATRTLHNRSTVVSDGSILGGATSRGREN